MMHQSPHMLMGSDASQVKGVKVGRRTVRRVLTFARPYRGALIAFVIVIIVQAMLALVPALLLRRIIDVAIPESNGSMLTVLAAFIVAAALAAATLSFVERFFSARIGEGLIYDLRVTLFDHVQRMPIAFFTRTQTGALISRINNDVIGAQRAVTGTLGSVVSNVIVLTTTLIAMLAARVAAHAAHPRAAAALHHPGQARRPPPVVDHPRGHAT